VNLDKNAELRRRLDVGLARVDGRFALSDHRADQHAMELTSLGARIADLEHRRWPLPALAALTTVGALIATMWQAMGR
jgi:hypothetical protein